VLPEEGELGQQQKKRSKQWDARRFEERFEELLKYRSQHGDCNVPTRQGKLGAWVKYCRKAHRANSLEQGCIDRLNSIGFKWTLTEQVPWETRYNELVQYKAKHGDCNIPCRQGKLGQWVSHQRVAYLADSLAQDRIDRLISIGFKWALKEGCWDTKFQELVRYKAKHGECKVPRSQGPLGTWAGKQRTTYRKGKLKQDRIDRLNGIGFDWTPSSGDYRKRKPLPSEAYSFEKGGAPILNRKTESRSVGDRARGDGPNLFESEDCGPEPVLSLPGPANTSIGNNHWTESDDEDDEIGALIYDQVMQKRQVPIRRRTRSSMKCK